MRGRPFQKGHKSPGRPKGIPNRLTTTVKEAIIEAFNQVGGVDYLVSIAKDDPKTFCVLVGKVIPLQVTGEDGKPIEMKITWEE